MNTTTLVEAPFLPVITELSDHDLYKLTMQMVMLHQNPSASGVTEFVCRSTPAYPLATLKREVERQLDHLCTLRFTEPELTYLAAKPFFKPDYIDFLRLFQLQRRFVTVSTDGDRLIVRSEGPLVHITMFEIFVLEIVGELYFRAFDQEVALAEGRRRLAAKIEELREFQFEVDTTGVTPFEITDFGSRRRFSRAWHEEVVTTLARELPRMFRGTSNVALARKHNLVCFGTMAHEHLQKHQGLGGQLKDSQKAALEEWVKEYRGDLGIALTDVINLDAFLKDFDRYFALLFDGLRHDSGDPVVWGDKILFHYKKLKIDAKGKRLVFSDGLSVGRAMDLWRHFQSRVMTGFGIGTSLTNDVGLTPINIVMKLMTVNDQPVAKISDAPGKTLCRDQLFLRYLCQVFGVDASFLDVKKD